MSACWPLQMPPTQKAVLISLADNANDHGECWPSQPKIAERTCLNERTVRNAIRWLEEAGYLVADRSNGRHTRYVVTSTPEPRSTPESDSAPERHSGQPRNVVPKPRNLVPEPRNVVPPNRKEPSRSVRSNRKVDPTPADLLSGLPEKLIADFIKVRKAKKLPLTETAVEGLQREARKAGLSLEAAVRMCCERGWGGFKADWVNRDSGQQMANDPGRLPRLVP